MATICPNKGDMDVCEKKPRCKWGACDGQSLPPNPNDLCPEGYVFRPEYCDCDDENPPPVGEGRYYFYIGHLVTRYYSGQYNFPSAECDSPTWQYGGGAATEFSGDLEDPNDLGVGVVWNLSGPFSLTDPSCDDWCPDCAGVSGCDFSWSIMQPYRSDGTTSARPFYYATRYDDVLAQTVMSPFVYQAHYIIIEDSYTIYLGYGESPAEAEQNCRGQIPTVDSSTQTC